MGELARQPGCPELPKTPLELITPRPGFDEGYSLGEKLSWPFCGAVGGLLFSFSANVLLKRPFWAGIHRHILLTALCAAGFEMYRQTMFADRAESDAVLKHYICLHPEDFPPFERKRYAEIYQPFDPAR